MTGETMLHWAAPRLVVVATNLTDSPALLSHAIAQARADQSKLLLVHVLTHPPAEASDSLIATSPAGAAWETLHRMVRTVEWQGVPCEPLLLEGDPVAEIARLVRDRNADRVVVATRSRQGVDRLVDGSVAEALMTGLDVPVCVIGPGVIVNGSGVCAGQVLVPLSLHHGRTACLQFAAELARHRHADLRLLHAISGASVLVLQRQEARRRTQELLEEFAQKFVPASIHLHITVSDADPVAAILAEGICPGHDLIVTGSPDLSVMAKLRGSSVVHRVIARARCPVITLRPGIGDCDHPVESSGESTRQPALVHSHDSAAALPHRSFYFTGRTSSAAPPG